MRNVAKLEISSLFLFFIVFAILLLPAALHTRRELRDGIRRNELTNFKTELEKYYNKHETYPLVFNANPHQYFVVNKDSKGAIKWFLRAKMENPHKAEKGFDEEVEHNYYYRYSNENNNTYFDICGGLYKCE